MNTKEVCRLINGYEKEGECRKSDYSNPKVPSGIMWTSACLNCKNHYGKIWKALKNLEDKHFIFSELRTFWDDHPQAQKATDRFRFWFIDKEYYKKAILSQTLEPYIKNGCR